MSQWCTHSWLATDSAPRSDVSGVTCAGYVATPPMRATIAEMLSSSDSTFRSNSSCCGRLMSEVSRRSSSRTMASRGERTSTWPPSWNAKSTGGQRTGPKRAMTPRSSALCDIAPSSVSSTNGDSSARRRSRRSRPPSNAATSASDAPSARARSISRRMAFNSPPTRKNSCVRSSRSSASGLPKTPTARLNHLSGKWVISQRTMSCSYGAEARCSCPMESPRPTPAAIRSMAASVHRPSVKLPVSARMGLPYLRLAVPVLLCRLCVARSWPDNYYALHNPLRR